MVCFWNYSLIVRNWMRWCSVILVTSVSIRRVMESRTFQLVAGFVIHALRVSRIASVYSALSLVVLWKELSKLIQFSSLYLCLRSMILLTQIFLFFLSVCSGKTGNNVSLFKLFFSFQYLKESFSRYIR